MTGWRVYPAISVAVALAGCSGVDEPTLAPPAEPRTLELGWVERSPELGLTFRVDRLVVRRDGWELTAAVRNRGGSEYFIQRPHQPGGSMFGLVLLRSTRRDEVRGSPQTSERPLRFWRRSESLRRCRVSFLHVHTGAERSPVRKLSGAGRS
jgi:hypothetical protein